MNKEKEFHREIQALRHKYASYTNSLEGYNKRKVQINNAFVDILILNEMLHNDLEMDKIKCSLKEVKNE